MSLTKDFVADYGGPTNGVTDCTPFYDTWRTAARLASGLCTLTFPGGHTYFFDVTDTDPNSNGGLQFADGIANLKIMSTGGSKATFLNVGSLGVSAGIKSGVNGTWPAFSATDILTARLNTVSAGSTTVQCTDSARAALFSANDWALISGFDPQGPLSTPPNNHFFEYVQVTAVNGGTITLSAPLRYSYQSGWPNYDAGTAGSQNDLGGPATLYVLYQPWNCAVEYQGIIFNNTGNSINTNSRSMTFTNCDMAASSAVIPTQCQTWNVTGGDWTGGAGPTTIEVDKFVGTMNISGAAFHRLLFQSSSADQANLTNGTTVDSISGTPKAAYLDATSSVGDWTFGPTSYGRTDNIRIAGNITTLSANSTHEDVDTSSMTMTAGIIKVPIAHKGISWAVPGTFCMFAVSGDNDRQFRVIDVWKDASFTYIQTDLPGTWPYVNPRVLTHPCPALTVDATATGDADLVDMKQMAAGRPIYSYSNRSYTLSAAGPVNGPMLWGRLVSLKINVTVAYNGTSACVLHISQFDNYNVRNLDYTTSAYAPNINLKITGQRIVTPANYDGLGGDIANQKSGDASLSLGSAYGWFTHRSQIYMDDGAGHALTVSGGDTPPQVTLEFTMDQGIGAQHLISTTRYRLHV